MPEKTEHNANKVLFFMGKNEDLLLPIINYFKRSPSSTELRIGHQFHRFLDQLEQGDWNLVILDESHEDYDIYTLLKQLRVDYKSIPCVVVGSHLKPSEAAKIQLAGANAYWAMEDIKSDEDIARPLDLLWDRHWQAIGLKSVAKQASNFIEALKGGQIDSIVGESPSGIMRVSDSKLLEELSGANESLQIKQKELENAYATVREKAEALETLSEAKGNFLANMSHELRTPLNSILGMTEMLLTGDLDETQQKWAGNVLKSGQILLELINDVLDFSKLEAKEMKLEFLPSDLRDDLRSLMECLQTNAEQRGNQLKLVYPKNIESKFIFDPMRLRQIMNNLMSNAIKFTENGQITIEVNVLEHKKHRMWVKIAIIDTGVGIPAEKIHSVFNTFSQADVSTTRKYGGTGLGLGICRELAQLMEGKIQVESHLDKGTKIWLEVPLLVQKGK